MARTKSTRCNGCMAGSEKGFCPNKKQAFSEDESSEVWNPSFSPLPADSASSIAKTFRDGTRCGLKSKNVKKKAAPEAVKKKKKCSTKAGVTNLPRDNRSLVAHHSVVCVCCNREISPSSQFEAHAGWAVKGRPSWFCYDCNKIHLALQKLVDNGAGLIPASILQDTIKKKHHTETDIVKWQILRRGNHCLDHLPILSGANELFNQCFSPIVAGSGPNLIPVMVYGREIPGQQFAGMHCVVLFVNSELVSAGLVRIFGPEVAELPLVATSKQHQGKGYFQAMFSCIENLLFSLNVENMVLPAAEKAESFWTQKLGFQRMSEERLLNYTDKYLYLTTFKGALMLEKKVQQQQQQQQQ